MLHRLSYLFLTLLLSLPATAQDWRLVYGLRGDWKFEIGDDKRWGNQNYDDSMWETIYAAAKWEDEGFPGYDGYAWYRKHFQASDDWRDKALFLRLGRIDDVDEVYVNGKLVGATGTFPPEYGTAYHVYREYPLPISYLKIPGDNVIAVRVYDDQIEGGIVEGKLGVYEDRNAILPDIPLAAEWKFETGDNLSWKDDSFDDSRWTKMTVPAYWESHGFPDYDGFAWYRITFRAPAEFTEQRMVLLLGMIDDYDETYLNGVQIGKTGVVGRPAGNNTNEYKKLRAYTVPMDLLRANQENTIAVRVYDGYRDGGIYRGPIGLVTRDRYKKWNNSFKRGAETLFDWIWK